jgi:hypothetical protein
MRYLAIEDRVRSILVRCDDELMLLTLEKLPQAELTGDAPQQLAGCEVDPLRSWSRLAIVVPLDPRDVVPRIRRGIAVHRIVIEDAKNLHHPSSFRMRWS